jgi:hypothetical protein
MKRYSTLHPLVMSFFSPKIYRDVAYAWRGACILYLLILVALTQVPNAVIFQRGASDFARKDAPLLIAQVPKMTFSNGTLSTEENRPYQIKDPESGALLVLVDTTGSAKALSDTTASVLFTATQLSVKRNENETRIITYSKNYAFVVTAERIARILEWIENYGAAVLYLCSVVIVLVYRMAQALVFSLAGLFLAKVMHVRLPFGAVYRLTAAAMTPALIIGALRTSLGTPAFVAPYAVLLFLALVFGYQMFAVKSCAGEASA